CHRALHSFPTRRSSDLEITSGLSSVTVSFHPTATPKEVTEGTYGGKRYFLRLAYGEADNPMRYMDYALADELAIVNGAGISPRRSEEHTSELQSLAYLV